MRSGSGLLVEEAASAQFPVEGDQGKEDHAGRAEMAEARQVVLPVRVHDRQGARKVLGRLVMVEHDRVEAEPARFGQGLVARRAAIDRHEEAGAPAL